jgi:hypothetical protein
MVIMGMMCSWFIVGPLSSFSQALLTIVQIDRLAYSFETKMIGATYGDYGYDVFLICSRTIIKF